MRISYSLRSELAFLIALGVTVSSIFATVQAAQQQSDAAGNVTSDAAANSAGPSVPVPPAPDVELVPVASAVAADPAPLDDEVLEPQAVLHDRQHEVQLDAQGGFSGQLQILRGDQATPAPYMNVRLIRDGALAANTVSGETGEFRFDGLTEGVYGLIGYGETGFVMYSLRLTGLAHDGNIPVSTEGAAANQVSLQSAIVTGADVAVAREIILSELIDRDLRFSTAANPKEQGDYPFGKGETSTSIGGHQVQLQPDGTLVGEVNLLDPRTGRNRELMDMTVHFIRDGELVSSSRVEQDGRFVVTGLTPGFYSFVGAGDDGVLALGVDVLGSLAANEVTNKYKLTSVAAGLNLVVAPLSPLNFNRSNAALLTDGAFDPAGGTGGAGGPGAIAGMGGFPGGFGPGGFGPGGFGPGGMSGGGLGGGGAGVGGGGGLGALLGAAAAGALGYALSEANKDPASPAR
ncbi:MAG: hypothetical protein KDA81_02005 [Planctomycetaceae bacterium]|nr:hypothetical protein [Planctomycetaceae bacterium]